METCQGCKLCIDKGEEYCPLKDDRDILIDKMDSSDGILFATPNYFFQVSASTKMLLDRIAYFGHRPHFFGKTWTNIVTQGIGGGGKISKYLNFIGNVLGCNTVKGCCLRTLEPMTEIGKKQIDKIIEKQSKKFYTQLIKKEYPKPSYSNL